MKTEAPQNVLRVSGLGSLQGILQSKNIELIKRVQELETENDRLRKAILTAGPHNMGCACLQGGPTREGWGKLEYCDCWKKDALR